ncbi:MAG: hypothetical protein JWP15_3187 [Alphaproteobacteria bacterium]|nr:hypothetical protein [Alphaproteobacteria bacterium]
MSRTRRRKQGMQGRIGRYAGRLAALAACAALGAAAAASPPSGYSLLTVDAGKTLGRLKPLRGVNGAPDMRFSGAAAQQAHPRPRPANLSSAYREASVDLVRTHDALAGDIDSSVGPLPSVLPPRPGGGGPPRNVDAWLIFPDPAADPEDSRSYNFGPTDQLVGGIRAIGAEVIFRLGRGGGTTAGPPQDLARYATIIRHIVLHYNKGWAEGFQSSVRYWEVWNEPDLGKIWWRGTPDDYYRLYEAASTAVKSADPAALVGGPTIALVNQAQPYREGFLAYTRDHRLPLDFFSWHYYSEGQDPLDFSRIGREMRGLLDRYGFQKTLSVLDEWNSGILSGRLDATASAAFIGSALVYMQDAPIDIQALYRADGEFGADGRTPTKIGQALIAWGRMRLTPLRLATHGGDDKGFALLAGRSEDGKQVQVLISNYEVPPEQRGPRSGPDVAKAPGGLFEMALPSRRSVSYDRNRGYDLTIRNLSARGGHVVELYALSASSDWKLVSRTNQSGSTLHIDGALAAPAVEMLVVHAK